MMNDGFTAFHLQQERKSEEDVERVAPGVEFVFREGSAEVLHAHKTETKHHGIKYTEEQHTVFGVV